MIRHISWLGASLLALGTACVQADPLAFPASLQGKAIELAPNDPDYARAAVEYAVKPAGQGGVSAALVVKITQDIPVYRIWNVSWSSFFEQPDRESAAQACTDAGLSWHCLSNSAGLILPSAEFRRFWL